MALVRDQTWPLSLKLGIGVALSFTVTALSYYLLERPFLKLKERFKAPAAQGVDKNMHITTKEELLAPSILHVQQSLS